MKTGEILTLSIIDVSRGGAGVARQQSGRTVFVPYTITGDVIKARIIDLKKKFANAELVEIISPAAGRVTPRCVVFGQCGGCQWQHVPYPQQWQIKLEGIRHTLQASQIKLVSAIEEYPATQIWNYRNRVQLRGDKDRLGYYAPRSHDIVAIEQCHIAHSKINNALSEIKRQGTHYSKPYKVEIEVTTRGELHTFWNEHHAAAGFRQVNDEQNPKLIQWIHHQLTSKHTIFDLYGGSANLSRDFAAQGIKVHCVDLSVPEIPPTDSPASLIFHQADVLPWLKQRITDIKFKRLPEPDATCAAIIDPPRGGLGDDFADIVERLDFFNVKEIVAVGCKTDTWTRDIARFIARGWKLQKVAAFDFFPHTVHVENTAYLARE
ncbi:class I SAM-dependent RNA methyltransferase [Kaarinaea lacus]